MKQPDESAQGLRSRSWEYAYRTSSATADRPPADMLHDFYIPALRLAVRYDRMAGYFRSSSLAAASQGFSAFVGGKGKMRLVVGVDLAPEDAEAILRGEEQRLEAKVCEELEKHATWPQDVKNGVELLAWMVANGYLEVRVAFRVHGRTGEPLAFEDSSDGYAHEKWAVFADEFGNRLYVSGSLNESRQALVWNAENIDVHCDWWGERECRRVDDAEEAFNATWQNRNPYLRVLTLPEAVRERLVQIASGVEHPREIDGTSAVPKKVAPPSALERLRFALIRDGPKLPRGRFVGMETAPVEPWPHQRIVARRLIETWPYSHLLCDEVGLGKTIEAGLAIRSLYLSGLVKRVLIAPPAALKKQWQRELAAKFFLPFARTETSPALKHHYIHPVEQAESSTSPYSPDLNIISSTLLARKERRREIGSADPFDVVLVDEAHAARRHDPTGGVQSFPEYGNLHRTLTDHVRSKTRSLWLATATPMQLDLIEVWDLLVLTDRVGAFQFDPTLMLEYYRSLGRLVRDQRIEGEEWEYLRRAITSLREHDPLLWKFIQDAVIDGRIRAAANRWLGDGSAPNPADRRPMTRLIFCAAPLSRVMLRHTRSLLEVYRERGELEQNLSKRVILPIPAIRLTSAEKDAYDELEAYCRELVRQLRQHSPNRSDYGIGFYLSFLRLRLASSFHAIRETVRRRRERVIATLEHLEEVIEPEESELRSFVFESEDDTGEELELSLLKDRSPEDLRWERDRLARIFLTLGKLEGTSSKMRELLRVLNERRHGGRIRQTVIFTRFYDTLTDIVGTLQRVDPRMLIGTYSGRGGQYMDLRTGRLTGVDREEVKQRFLRGELDVLVCTDAAAEGLNLQTADLIVNFDLPWNPMKVEQRVGRIDRIGQRHDTIYVLNLCYVDSAEQVVYGRLLDRLSEAAGVMGTLQFSILPVTEEEFMQLAEGSLDPAELEERALHRARQHQQLTASMEIPPRDLHDIYIWFAKSGPPAPVDLDAIWDAVTGSRYLGDLGCTVLESSGGRVFQLSGLPSIAENMALTVSRDLYETGVEGWEGRLHFASYGDPYFEAMLREIGAFELPPCIRRLGCRVGYSEAEVVGYVTACRADDGQTEIRLLTCWKDLTGLTVEEEAELTDAEVAPLQERLEGMAQDDLQPILAAARIERGNVRAGHAQRLLTLYVAKELIRVRGSAAGDAANFWAVVKDVEDLLQEERTLSFQLPAEQLRRLENDFVLFKPTIPLVGQHAGLRAPPQLLRAALDEARRQADAMKKKKSELKADAVIARLDREIENVMRRLEKW